MLPFEISRRLVKCQQTSQVNLGGVSLQVTCTVVGTDKDLFARNDRVAISLAAQVCEPLDVLGFGFVPSSRAAIKFSDMPILRQVFDIGNVVLQSRPAPLWPIASCF